MTARKAKSEADTEELKPLRRPRKRATKRRETPMDALLRAVGSRAGGVKRLMKVTEGVERLLWAAEQADSNVVKQFNESELDDADILVAAQIASALIIIRDGLEVGG